MFPNMVVMMFVVVVINVFTCSIHQEDSIQCMQFPLRKCFSKILDQCRFCRGERTGGSISKNGNLTDQVCFVCQTSFILTKSAQSEKSCAGDH